MGEAPLLNGERAEVVRNAIIEWYRRNGRAFPWRQSDDPFRILIAEMLLRRTTATAVARIYPDFIQRFDSLARLGRARKSTIERALSTVGLQSVRAIHLQRMARTVLKEYDGKIPKNLAALEALPGVGRYGAAAVMNFAFGATQPMVDGNVVHLINRIFSLGVSDPTARMIWEFMKQFGGSQDKKLYWGIIDIVATICFRKVPHCHDCPLSEYCDFYAANPK
jgi:A/G-specific adenine glycosylase